MLVFCLPREPTFWPLLEQLHAGRGQRVSLEVRPPSDARVSPISMAVRGGHPLLPKCYRGPSQRRGARRSAPQGAGLSISVPQAAKRCGAAVRALAVAYEARKGASTRTLKRWMSAPSPASTRLPFARLALCPELERIQNHAPRRLSTFVGDEHVEHVRIINNLARALDRGLGTLKWLSLKLSRIALSVRQNQ